MRRQGLDDDAATKRLDKVSVAERNELLFKHGINFNDLPAWQRRGIGVRWEDVPQEAIDPRTGAKVTSTRRRLKALFDLAMKDGYDDFVREIVARQ